MGNFTGAMVGAGVGSAMGPFGTGVGFVIGGITGTVTGVKIIENDDKWALPGNIIIRTNKQKTLLTDIRKVTIYSVPLKISGIAFETTRLILAPQTYFTHGATDHWFLAVELKNKKHITIQYVSNIREDGNVYCNLECIEWNTLEEALQEGREGACNNKGRCSIVNTKYCCSSYKLEYLLNNVENETTVYNLSKNNCKHISQRLFDNVKSIDFPKQWHEVNNQFNMMISYRSTQFQNNLIDFRIQELQKQRDEIENNFNY
jgi:hypothetical protein